MLVKWTLRHSRKGIREIACAVDLAASNVGGSVRYDLDGVSVYVRIPSVRSTVHPGSVEDCIVKYSSKDRVPVTLGVVMILKHYNCP